MVRKILLGAALWLPLTCGLAFPASAAALWETEVINRAGLGDVSIRLEEFQLDAKGNEVPYENGKLVLPGQRVSKLVRITNEAEPVWVRARLAYITEDGIDGLSDQMVTLASDQWVKAGDYYYYTAPVESGGCVDFIREVRIPPEWDESFMGKSFSIAITADAVQQSSFTPDLTADEPWFGTVIETCVHRGYEPFAAENAEFFVVFEGGSRGLIRIGEDFFSNWGSLMPGDTVSDRVQVRNSSRRPVTVYFRTETIADDELLRALKLEIKAGDRLLYSGSMAGTVRRLKLARLGCGEETEILYQVHVPEELNNRYAQTSARTKWIFSVSEDSGDSGEHDSGDEDSFGSGSGGGGSEPGEGSPPASGPGESQRVPEAKLEYDRIFLSPGEAIADAIRKLPRTGDTGTELYALLIFAASVAGIWILRKREGEENHE